MKKVDLELNLDLKKHIDSLKLKTVKEYVSWCKSHGFSQGMNKTTNQRKKESEFYKEQIITEEFNRNKSRLQSPEKIITLIANSNILLDDIKSPILVEVFNLFKSKKYDSKEKILEYFLELSKKSDLLSLDMPFPKFSKLSYLNALTKLFDYSYFWIRSLESWEPKSYNIHKQFLSLTRHLFCKYEMPVFMDTAWFSSIPKHQDWFILIAQGENVRKVLNPLNFTKKQAHSFLQAPPDYTVRDALRWGQIKGLGGDIRLIEELKNSYMTEDQYFTPFWDSVIDFFIKNPMLDRDLFFPIIDYIKDQKFSVNAQQPNFDMTFRTADALVKQVEEWHNRLAKQKPKKNTSWESTKILSYSKEEGVEFRKSYKLWTITELLNSKELTIEGMQLKHCVGSFSGSCLSGRTSIWSLKVKDVSLREERVLTIEVANSRLAIVQARGKLNRRPTTHEYQVLCDWASQAKLTVVI